jgi:hypothetical protein
MVLSVLVQNGRNGQNRDTPTMPLTIINNTVNTHAHTGITMGFHTTALCILALLVVGTISMIWLVSFFLFFIFTCLPLIF